MQLSKMAPSEKIVKNGPGGKTGKRHVSSRHLEWREVSCGDTCHFPPSGVAGSGGVRTTCRLQVVTVILKKN